MSENKNTGDGAIKTQNTVVAAKTGGRLFLRMSAKEKILFAKRLSMLLKSGMPILDAVNMLKSQAGGKSSAFIIKILAEDVESGRYLHASLGRFRKVFGDFALNLIRVGEMSGTLQENLSYMAEQLQKQQALRSKVVGALVYPVFIITATFGITGLLTFYVFPKILPIFQSFNFQLPVTTRILIFTTGFFARYGFGISLGLACLAGGIFFALKRPEVNFWADRQLLRLPVFGRMFSYYHLACFSRTLGILLKGELLIVEAVKVTAEISASPVYARQFRIMAEKLARGEKLSSHLMTEQELFPQDFSQMVGIGEASGSLSDTLLFLAEMYEAEVEDITKNMSSLIEPLLMIFMGVLVGFIALSIITPIYQLTSNLHP